MFFLSLLSRMVDESAPDHPKHQDNTEAKQLNYRKKTPIKLEQKDQQSLGTSRLFSNLHSITNSKHSPFLLFNLKSSIFSPREVALVNVPTQCNGKAVR
jgi:hypothetical protein